MSKKPLLILHIGSPKTGTSALQNCMARNRGFLLENKICYSHFSKNGGIDNHNHLTYHILYEFYQNNTDLKIPQDKRTIDIITKIKKEFYENDSYTLIISSETLFETVWTGSSLEIFAENTEFMMIERRKYVINYFKEEFKGFDIKIVCYLRRQDDYIESIYNEMLKNIAVDNNVYNNIFANPLPICFGKQKYTAPENSCNAYLENFINGLIDAGYYTNLSQWAETYGKENIIVRIYEKSALPKGVEYDFFTNILNFNDDLLQNIELYQEVNLSLKKDIAEYKRVSRLLEFREELTSISSSPALEHLGENNRKNILKAKQADEILEYYKEENEKIAREYLGRKDGILFYDKKREEKDDYPGLSLQTAINVSKELIYAIKNTEEVKLKKSNESNLSLKAELAKSNESNLSLKAELDKSNAGNLSLKAELDKSNASNLSLKTELDKSNASNLSLKAELDKLKIQINEIYQSTSWKITKPLRAVKRLFAKNK
jgi:hypothetical protein